MKYALTLLAFAILFLFTETPSQWIGINNRIGNSVHRVESLSDGQTRYCSSALINSSKGYVLTAAHCIPVSGRVSITVGALHAEVTKINYILDLAVLRVDGIDGKQIYQRKEPVEIGLKVAVVGYAFAAKRPKYTFGHISDPEDTSLWDGTIIDIEVIPGQSGGIVVDEAGRFVGTTQAYISIGASKLGIAASMNAIRNFAGEYWGKPESSAAK